MYIYNPNSENVGMFIYIYKFLESCWWNLVPFLPDIGFQLLKSLWSSLAYFSFNDAPNVLYR